MIGNVVFTLDAAFLRPRDMDTGDAGAAIVLLFTLPVIRSSMPLSPPLGIILDYGGLFWCEAVA